MVTEFLVYCSRCGTQNREDAKFCLKCGAALHTEEGRTVERLRRDDSSKLLPIMVILVAVVIISIASFGIIGRWWPLGPVIGSGNLVTLDRSFSDFTVVEAGWGFEVTITKSEAYSVSITTDDNMFDYVQISKSGSTLNINLKPGTYNRVTLKANIKMPLLRALQLSGGSQCYVKSFNVPPYYSGVFTLDLSGGSFTEMEGSANKISIEASGGSRLDLSDFPVHDAYVEFSGGSRGTINIDGRLDADLSGGSQLYYIGEPTLGDIDMSGGSTIGKR